MAFPPGCDLAVSRSASLPKNTKAISQALTAVCSLVILHVASYNSHPAASSPLSWPLIPFAFLRTKNFSRASTPASKLTTAQFQLSQAFSILRLSTHHYRRHAHPSPVITPRPQLRYMLALFALLHQKSPMRLLHPVRHAPMLPLGKLHRQYLATLLVSSDHRARLRQMLLWNMTLKHMSRQQVLTGNASIRKLLQHKRFVEIQSRKQSCELSWPVATHITSAVHGQ
jgi:hypothetical protein